MAHPETQTMNVVAMSGATAFTTVTKAAALQEAAFELLKIEPLCVQQLSAASSEKCPYQLNAWRSLSENFDLTCVVVGLSNVAATATTIATEVNPRSPTLCGSFASKRKARTRRR
jgi:hypothetical protein